MAQYSEDDMKAAFQAVDEDGSGSIDAKELRKCMDVLLSEATEEDIQKTTDVSYGPVI